MESQPPARIQQEMTRSFPGFFSTAPARGRKRFRAPCRVVTTIGKSVTLQFYLLNKNTDRTPTSSNDLALLLAGMGRRTITLPESADHMEISRLLISNFPKLGSILGGWLLYKAPGGSGQRKLTVIPQEAEGYNGQYLKNMTGGGKSVIYILPLQEELSTSPLPHDAIEFEKMPKAACRMCGAIMPLQVLSAHVQSCGEENSSASDFNVDALSSSPDVTVEESGSSTSQGTPKLVACPLCGIEYREDILAVHASSCGDSLGEETSEGWRDKEKSTGGEIKNLDGIIQAIQDAVVTDGKTFDLTVSRQNLVERGLLQWQRQKKSSPVYQLKVTFLGEAGVDTGALRKEFLTGMIEGVEARFFELGTGTHGRRPMYSLSNLDKGYFRTIGQIVAASLAQGGPAPNFLMEWCYHVLCTGSLDIENLTRSDVGEEYADLLSRVEVATEMTIKDLTQDILNCGYTGHISCEKKDEIIRSIVLHANLRLLPMLLQMREGLTLYGLSDFMSKYPDICKPLFVPGVEMKADADFILSVCKAEYSETGSNKEQVEQAIMNHLQDFLQELEQDDADPGIDLAGCPSLSPRTFLQWVTGQGHVPVLQEEKRHFKVNIKFNHDCQQDYGEHRICYPLVAACTSTITFPVQHMSAYDNFKVVLLEAFLQGQEFLRV